MRLHKFLQWQLWFHYLLLALIMGPLALYVIPSAIGNFNVCYLNPPFPYWFVVEYVVAFGMTLTIVDILIHLGLEHYTGWSD